MGNLKSMASTGGLRLAAKRTAFGEVSNIVNNVRPAQENKWKPPVKTQPAVVLQDKENGGRYPEGSFNQPAQRPSKQASFASAGINLPTARPATSHQEESQIGDFVLPESRAPAAKPTLAKKATFVYQDNHVTEPSQTSTNTSTAADGLIIDEKSKNPRRYKSHPHLTFELSSHQQMDREELENMEELIHFDDDVTEAPYEDAVEDFVNPYELLKTQFPDPSLRTAEAPGVTHEPQAAIVPKPVAEEAPLPSATSEPEEYWDEYEEEDLYDEQGYTTAHSYRSHGDTTTGGATTLVLPKITARIQMELDAAKAHVEATRLPEDVEEESWDISMVAEYGDEIFEYMKELEVSVHERFSPSAETRACVLANNSPQGKMIPNPHYMDIQTEIQWSMRSVLMDWLIQVHNRFSLLPETLFLTVNYIDRFLSTKIVSLGKLQLVGATAIFIAAKYEEINCPSIQEIIFMVDSGYSVDEILKAERFMLSMLGFELGWPGPMSFLRRISKADDYDLETRTLAKYFLEVTVMDERFVGSPPSFLAAGAHCLARLMLTKGDWVRGPRSLARAPPPLFSFHPPSGFRALTLTSPAIVSCPCALLRLHLDAAEVPGGPHL